MATDFSASQPERRQLTSGVSLSRMPSDAIRRRSWLVRLSEKRKPIGQFDYFRQEADEKTFRFISGMY